MFTKFGIEAKEGDYVLVLDVNYKKGSAVTYLAKVHNEKAYTGMKFLGGNRHGKYIHKLSAEIVVPESSVPQHIKDCIEEDINLNG